MIPADLLELLRCPITRQRLVAADADQLKLVNARLPAAAEPLTAALLRVDASAAYPVKQGIPVLVAEEVIELS